MVCRHFFFGMTQWESRFDNENTDEYDPETGTLLPRLVTCNSSSDVLRVVHEEFCRWFGPKTAGSPEQYTQIADEVWQLWQARSGPLDSVQVHLNVPSKQL
jgi:hypothetical protein